VAYDRLVSMTADERGIEALVGREPIAAGRIAPGRDSWTSARQLPVMSPATAPEVIVPRSLSGGAIADFEQIYRDNVGVVTAYFARRCSEPQEVADLTSETILRAAGSFGTYDPRRGTARAWLFGIAAHVYARHCEKTARGREATIRLAGHRTLEPNEIEELTAKIDAQQEGRRLLDRCARLSENERAAIEMVDLAELTPKEAAAVLGVPRGVLRMRLSRARARLRKEESNDE
jgi:RNA polymerase sigma-70 factor, ECF subfamily